MPIIINQRTSCLQGIIDNMKIKNVYPAVLTLPVSGNYNRLLYRH